jgi:hypothetical protein
MMKSNKWLRRQFLKLNRTGFKNSLPFDTVVKFGKLDILGETSRKRRCCEACGTTVNRFVITINERLRWSATASMQTLVHEMVHVEHWDWFHNKKFYNRVYKIYEVANLKRFL